MPQKVGVLGGTFDPIHNGHLRTAEEAADVLNLDLVLFIPAALPPHKPGDRTLAFEHRWRMIELAISGNFRFQVSDLERRMPGKSYTVNTLRKIREEIRDVELYFLVGTDAFLELNTWWHYKELFELACMTILRRPGFGGKDLLLDLLTKKVSGLYKYDPLNRTFVHPHLYPVICLKNTYLEISSTRIRHLEANGMSIRYLVPEEVMSYISSNKLYVSEGTNEYQQDPSKAGVFNDCSTSGESH